jgi:hypothetical protein
MSEKDLKYTILEVDVSSRLHTANMNIDVIQDKKLPFLKKCNVTSSTRWTDSSHVQKHNKLG